MDGITEMSYAHELIKLSSIEGLMCPSLTFVFWGLKVGFLEHLEFESFLVSYTFTFTFSHLADAFVQSDVQGRE